MRQRRPRRIKRARMGRLARSTSARSFSQAADRQNCQGEKDKIATILVPRAFDVLNRPRLVIEIALRTKLF